MFLVAWRMWGVLAAGVWAGANNLKDGSGLVYVQEGTLDRLDEWFPPQAEVLTWTRQPWMRSLDLQQFDHGPS